MRKSQFNVRLPDKICDRIREDSDKFGRKVTRDVVVAAIADDFFSAWTIKERGAFYEAYLKKLEEKS